VGQFNRDGNEALRVIDGAILQDSNNTALVTQLQTIRSTFATCEQMALQNLATAINLTVPTTTTTPTTTTPSG
jgi:alpha-galactosidase